MDMSRNEIYIALALVSLLLVSVVWKHELAYRRSLLSDQKPVEIEIPQYQQKPFVPDTTAKGYLGKRKPSLSHRNPRQMSGVFCFIFYHFYSLLIKSGTQKVGHTL